MESNIMRVPPNSAENYMRIYESATDFNVAKEAIYRFGILASAKALQDCMPSINEPTIICKHLYELLEFTKELIPTDADRKKMKNAAAADEYASTRARCVAILQNCNVQSAEQYKKLCVPQLHQLIKLWSAAREAILPIKNNN